MFGQVRPDRDEHRIEAAFVSLGDEVIDPMIAGELDAHGRDPAQLDIQHVTRQPVAGMPYRIIPPGIGPASRISTSWPRRAKW